MAKPSGFMEYERALPPDRPPAERVKDWGEFHTIFESETEAKAQGLPDDEAIMAAFQENSRDVARAGGK